MLAFVNNFRYGKLTKNICLYLCSILYHIIYIGKTGTKYNQLLHIYKLFMIYGLHIMGLFRAFSSVFLYIKADLFSIFDGSIKNQFRTFSSRGIYLHIPDKRCLKTIVAPLRGIVK